MALPFPSFGHDRTNRRCLFIGEDHTQRENLVQLCWQMMYLAGQVDAVFIEYYMRGASPTPGNIRTELHNAQFLQHRNTMHFEVADLRHQCQRRGIALEGWNKANHGGVLNRVTPSWNNMAALLLTGRAEALGVNTYIIFGGSVHGPLFAASPSYPSLPCFMVYQGRFRQYDQSGGGGVTWTP